MVRKRSRWLKRLLLLLFLGALAAIIVWALIPPPLEVEVAEARRGGMQVAVDEDGQTRVKERYLVSSPLAGRLLRISLDAGDGVEKGTVLAVIEPRDPQLLDARARAEAEARVRAAEAALARSKAQLQRAKVNHEYAATDLDRADRLIEKGNISQQEFDRVAQLERLAEEELRAGRFSVDVAEHDLELARAALPLTRGRSSRGRFQIRSPIAGRVLRVVQESAGVVEASQTLLELGDPADLEVVVDVLSSDGVKIRPGARTLFEHWGGEERLLGRVRLVEPSAFTKVSALGVEEQRVNVIIDFIDPPEGRPALGDAFRVEARIVIWESDDALKIPLGALFRESGRWTVFRIEDGRASQVPVRLGQRNDLEAEVLEGLSEQDRIILHPSDSIRPGIRVQPRH